MTSISSTSDLIMSRAILTVAILPALLTTAGCFDVHDASPNPWVIDDFEDGDLKPADSNFGPWTCYTFNPANQDCSVGLDPGDESTYALFLQFTIVDPPDLVAQNGAALLQTSATTTPEDLSRFGEMVFSAKLASDDSTFPEGTELNVQLGCSTVRADDGTAPGNLYVVRNVSFTSDWNPYSVDMASFGSPPFFTTHVLGGPTTCLQHVDSVQFEVYPSLSDGQSATGRLDVDDVYFQ
jgi:hypothetical protein